MTRVFAALAILLLPSVPAASDEKTPQKPPLTKEQERERFHPRTTGMEPGVRLAGFQKRLEMEKASTLRAIRFRNVGPEIQGGRIVAVEAPSARPDSLVVAFASGGLWRTDNRGGSWTPLFDGESAITIGDFALADGEGRTIYVGTGESNSSRSSYAGTGVFKTEDGGKTWTNVGLQDSHHVGSVLVDPRDRNVVYVAAMGHLYTENAERGVYRSGDGGRTWTRVLFVDERTGAIDLVQDPSRPDVLYAATWERARSAANFLESGPGSGLWKSRDSGKTWARLSGGLPSGATLGRIGIAIAPSKPDTLYAVVDNQSLRPESEPPDEETPPGELTPRRLRKLSAAAFAKLEDAVVGRFLRRYDFPKELKPERLKKDVGAGRIAVSDLVAYMQDANRSLFENQVVGLEVYRSDDGGGTWRRTHEGRIEQVFYSYGYYFGRIAVDPLDPQRLYLAGVPLISSTDGGKTWKGLDQQNVHVDHHEIVIDPKAPHRVILGNDGGLNLSFDHGATWTKVNNIPAGQFTTLALDNADPYHIVGGLQDNGVMRGPSTYKAGRNDPTDWQEIYGGDGSCVVVDPKDDDVVYAALQFGFAARLNLKTKERTPIRPRPELSAKKKEKPLRYNWVTPFILSPHSNQVLYYGANRLYRSFDRGDTWTAISPDLTSDAEQGDVPFGTITSVSESPKTFGVLYAGTDEGKVWGTRDGGVTWADLSAGLAKSRWVTRVVASAFDEGTVYVSQNGYRNDDFAAHVFRSTDFGKTWEDLAAGLPPEPVNTVREDPKARHLLYVGTDLGVFVSLDRGKTWTPMTGGLPKVPVHDVLVHPREGDLVVATHGRSVYVAPAAPLRRLKGGVTDAALHAFPIKPIKGDPRRGYGEHPYITWFRDEPIVRVAYWSKAGGQTTITIKDENGNVWQQMPGTSDAGMNVVEYDLSANPRKADAAEAAARDKALAKRKDAAKDKKAAAPKPAPTPTPEPDEEEEDGEEDQDEKPAADDDVGSALDPELREILSDPFRSQRRRYLAPGRYTVEIRSGSAVATTTLRITPPKDQDAPDEQP
jgi:photosystem II stability/assembly factor-like uncharacterized protein